MEIGENRRVVERYFDELWNRGNLAVADEIIAADFSAPMPPPNHPLHGPGDVKEFVAADRLGYPDLGFSIDETVAEADKVVARWTMRGTHLGTWKVFAPTGRSIAFSGITIFTVKGGRIHSFQVVSDALGVLQQLGVVTVRPTT